MLAAYFDIKYSRASEICGQILYFQHKLYVYTVWWQGKSQLWSLSWSHKFRCPPCTPSANNCIVTSENCMVWKMWWGYSNALSEIEKTMPRGLNSKKANWGRAGDKLLSVYSCFGQSSPVQSIVQSRLVQSIVQSRLVQSIVQSSSESRFYRNPTAYRYRSTSLMFRPYTRERVWLHKSKSKSLGPLQNLKASNEIPKRHLLE